MYKLDVDLCNLGSHYSSMFLLELCLELSTIDHVTIEAAYMYMLYVLPCDEHERLSVGGGLSPFILGQGKVTCIRWGEEWCTSLSSVS